MSRDTQRAHHPMYDQDARPGRTYRQAEGPVLLTEGRPAGGGSSVPASGQVYRAKRPPQPAGSGGGQPPRKKKKSRKKKLVTALVAVLLVFAVLGTVVFAMWHTIQGRIKGENTEAGTLPTEVQTLPEFKGSHVNFLVCGIDYNNEDADGFVDPNNKTSNTDMIMYVNYNIAENEANILQLPRDTYVGDEVATGNKYRVNALYPNAPDPNNRMAALAQVLYDQFALPVDFYVTIDMDALKEIVDIKGYVDIFVPQDIIDPTYNIQIDEGWQRLGADHVEFLLRNRHSPNYNDQGDIARLRTQQSFYSAMFREFKSLAPVDLVKWMNVLTYRCKTDMDLWDLGGIAQKALALEGEDITFVRPSVAPTVYNGEFVISIIPEDMADLLNEYFRPEGQTVPVEEMDIQTLPVDPTYGIAEAEIKTMSSVQAGETPMPQDFN